MYRILLFIFFAISLNVFSQTDTILVKSNIIEKQTFHFQAIPKNINSLPVIKKIIKYRENDFFNDYFFLFFLNLLLITVFLLQVSKSKLKKLISTLYSINVLSQYSKVEIKRDNKYLLAYFILVFFFISILMFLTFKKLNIEVDVVYISFLILLFFTIDVFVHKISSYLFGLKEVSSVVHFNNYSFIILILPFLVVSILVVLYSTNIVFTELVISIILILLALFYLWKELRNIFILKASKINVFSFYFFLYLCTFKLLPLVILFKIAFAEISKT